jgi:CRISPR-associated helicase Cas3
MVRGEREGGKEMGVEDEVIEACRQAVGENYESRPLQEEAIKRVVKWLENGAEKPFILRLPTGYGKTLIGLAPALYQMREGNWKYFGGLLYVLPMRGLCRQITDNCREYLGRLLTDKERDFIVKEFHGAAPFSGRFSGDVIVATYDVFVYAYARKLGAKLDYPAGTIATSMVVLDEAQMLQDEYFYSYTLLQKVLEALTDSGIPVLLMTATLPRKIKETLFPDMDVKEFSPSSEELSRERLRGDVKDIHYGEGRAIDVTLLREYIERYREIVGEHPKTIFMVFNTVKRLLEMLERLRREDEILGRYRIECLHGRQKNAERGAKAQMLEKICGDPAERDPNALGEHEGMILLATQVVEAGVDLSCNLMLTELAPLDSIVQRMGRCARFRGEDGLLVITEVENAEPYPKRLIDSSRDVIKEESSTGLRTALLDYQNAGDLINKAYERWVPEEMEDARLAEEFLHYVSYFERSLGPLNGDLETAKELRFRLDDYVEIVFPHQSAELKYYVVESVSEYDKWRRDRSRLRVCGEESSSNIMSILEQACSLQDDRCIVLVAGKTILDDMMMDKGEGDKYGYKAIEEWINDNSVSVSLNHRGRGGRDEKKIREAITWRFNDTSWIFALLEVPREAVKGAGGAIMGGAAAIIKPIRADEHPRLPRGLARIYLGRPEFYKKDVGFRGGE